MQPPTTVLEIEAEIGISRTTIYKHLEEIKGLEFEVEFEQKIKKLRRSALEQLYSIGASQNNIKALTEFLKWTEKNTRHTKESVSSN